MKVPGVVARARYDASTGSAPVDVIEVELHAVVAQVDVARRGAVTREPVEERMVLAQLGDDPVVGRSVLSGSKPGREAIGHREVAEAIASRAVGISTRTATRTIWPGFTFSRSSALPAASLYARWMLRPFAVRVVRAGAARLERPLVARSSANALGVCGSPLSNSVTFLPVRSLQRDPDFLVVAAELLERVEDLPFELHAHVDAALGVARADVVRERKQRPRGALRRVGLESPGEAAPSSGEHREAAQLHERDGGLRAIAIFGAPVVPVALVVGPASGRPARRTRPRGDRARRATRLVLVRERSRARGRGSRGRTSRASRACRRGCRRCSPGAPSACARTSAIDIAKLGRAVVSRGSRRGTS